MTGQLFDPGDPTPAEKGLSAGQRLTLRNNQKILRGVHPATGVALLNQPAEHMMRCGDCLHLYPTGEPGRRFWKCALVTRTFGAATDVRKSWPACIKVKSSPETRTFDD